MPNRILALALLLALTAPAAFATPAVTLTAPANGAKALPGTNVTLAANASDSTDPIASVAFLEGANLIGTATAPPYSVTWSNAPTGAYTITAKATNVKGVAKVSGAAKLTVNTPPTVALTAPAAKSSFVGVANINLTADATDVDGQIASVQFYRGGTLIGSTNQAPYSISWTGALPGSYSLTVRAVDNLGAVTTSTPVAVTVTNPVTVALTSPAATDKFQPPANVVLAADASTPNSTISKVEFFNGTALVGTASSAPFSFNWANVGTGGYNITAKATDAQGLSKTSAARRVVVNTPPTVSLAPLASASYVGLADIPLGATAADSDGTIIKVAFYRGSTLISTATSAPYGVTWVGAAPGTYALTARATDDLGATTISNTVNVTVANPVTVALTTPTANARFAPGATVELAANPSSSNSSIAKVDFYVGTTLLGSAVNVPFAISWPNVPTGKYSVTAKATDSQGITRTSTAVPILVDTAPTVSLSAPLPNATYAAPAAITLAANVSDPDGNLAKVQFYNGGTLLGTVTSAPYNFTWINVAKGSYTLRAKAIDALGLATTSAGVAVKVGDNQAPSVALTSPAGGQNLVGPLDVNLAANASDVDGAVAQVQFFLNGTVPLGTVSQPPYAMTWTAAPVGSHSITAVATDNLGATTSSAPLLLNIAANTPPTVVLTSPAAPQALVAPANVTLSANAADLDGTVQKVEFFNGDVSLGAVAQPPYTRKLEGLAVGSYKLFARATDSTGATTDSAAVVVTVNPNSPPTVSLAADPSSARAPAAITLTATAADQDGSVAKVEFFNGDALLGTAAQAPFSFNWTNVAAGNYTLKAKATDNLGASTLSDAVSVAVSGKKKQQVYYVQADHLNTPRVVTDAVGGTVWEWGNDDPFGSNPANEDPNGTGKKFVFNLRFPGQYFDRETGLHHNYYRDYDPVNGRYVQSDPIGLDGGINTYVYGNSNPLVNVDPSGTTTAAGTVVIGGVVITAACMATPGCAKAMQDAAATAVCMATPLCANAFLAAKAINAICRSDDEKSECDRQWADAREYCRDLYVNGYRPRPGGKGVGGINIVQCEAGQVTEACGGNKVEYR